MLIEINDRPNEGVVVFDKKTQTYKLIPFEELSKDIVDTLKSHTEELESLIGFKNSIAEFDPIGVVKSYTEKFDNDVTKQRLVNFAAFELLQDDINYEGIDEPENYEEIRKWVRNPTKDIPEGFEKYIKIVLGEESEVAEDVK